MGGLLGQVVAPGGKIVSDPRQLLTQQGHKQLSIQPSAAALIIQFRNMAQLNHRLQTLECEFDLSPQPIAFQHLSSAGLVLGQGCEHQDIAGILLLLRCNRTFAFLLLEGEFALGPLDRLFTLPDPA